MNNAIYNICLLRRWQTLDSELWLQVSNAMSVSYCMATDQTSIINDKHSSYIKLILNYELTRAHCNIDEILYTNQTAHRIETYPYGPYSQFHRFERHWLPASIQTQTHRSMNAKSQVVRPTSFRVTRDHSQLDCANGTLPSSSNSLLSSDMKLDACWTIHDSVSIPYRVFFVRFESSSPFGSRSRCTFRQTSISDEAVQHRIHIYGVF
jgi:hypothetical protein